MTARGAREMDLEQDRRREEAFARRDSETLSQHANKLVRPFSGGSYV